MMKIQKTQENGVGSTIEEENDGDDEEDEIESNEKLIMRRRSSGRNRSSDHQKKEEAGMPQERAHPPKVENSESMQSMGDWNYDYFFQTMDNYPRPSLEVKAEKVMENDESKVFDEIPKRKENVEEKWKEVPPPPVVEDVAEEERVVAAAASGGGSVGRNVKRGKSTGGMGEKRAGKGSMNLLHVFVELDDHFLKASVSAHDVSKMLEATQLHYHSNLVDNRGLLSIAAPPLMMFFHFFNPKISPHIDHLVGWNLMARPGNKIIQAKLVLLGDMGTGKTSLALRFIKGQFYDQQEATIGAAFFTQTLSLSEATVKFDIWDTAGQERYHSLAPMYYRGAAAAVVVYDISNMDTFNRAKKLVQELQRQGNQIVVMALAANKSDLDSQREVPTEEGEQFSQENGMFYIETSAKTAQNINELFYEIAKRLARVSPPKCSGISLNPETPERKGFCCLG